MKTKEQFAYVFGLLCQVGEHAADSTVQFKCVISLGAAARILQP